MVWQALPHFLMASIALFVGFFTLLLFWTGARRRLFLPFAFSCISIGIYDFLCGEQYLVFAEQEICYWQQYQYVFLSLTVLSLMWFLADYSGFKNRRLMLGLTAYISTAVLLLILLPIDWLFDLSRVVVIEMELPFDLMERTVNYPPTALLEMYSLSALGIFAIAVHIYRSADALEPSRKRAFLILGVIFFLGLLNDLFVSLQAYAFIFLTEYSYLAIILLMAYALGQELKDVMYTRQALEESEQRFSAFMNNLPAAAILKNQSMEVIYANQYSREVLGAGDWVGKPSGEFLPEDIRDAAAAADRDAMETGHSICEDRLYTKEGVPVVFETHKFPVVISEGQKVLGIIAVDITHRKEVEDALRNSEENLFITLQSIGDGVITTDMQGRITRMNPIAETLTGWKQEEAISIPVSEVFHVIHEMSLDELINPAMQVLGTGEMVQLENHALLVARDGTLRPVADSAAPIRNRNGDLVGVVLVFRDQTRDREARRAIEAARDELERRVEERTRELAVEREHFRSLMLGAQGFALFRVMVPPDNPSEAQLIFGSPSLAKILGGIDEARFATWTQHVHPEDKPGIDRKVYDSLHHARVFREESRIQTKEGVTWLSVLALPVRDPKTKQLYFNGIMFDITDAKLAEDALIRAERMAAVGTLAGGVAHEFNNINVSVLGFAQLALERQDLSDDLRHFLSRICKAALRAKSISQNLLMFSGLHKNQLGSGDLNEVTEESLSLIEHEMETEGIVVHRQFSPLPEIRMDPRQIGQVILNLLLNARHALLGREVKEITVSSAQEADAVILRVRDTGCGIPQDKLATIFSPFYSTKGEHASPGSPQAVVRGTGLGLSVSHTIINRHDGTILVESVVGEGTTFTIRLPLRIPEVAEEISAGITEGGGASARILVLDDEPDIHDLLVRHCDRLGHAVVGEQSGAKALARLEEEPFDLLLLDLQMPQMNGQEFLTHLDGIAPDKRPSVILMTGKPTAEITDLIASDKITDVLLKPFELDTVTMAIEKALRRRRQSSS